jgi:deoxyribodipyrimidine photo-lyase
MLSLVGQIPGIQLLVGSFADLQKQAGDRQIIYKEHPLNRHYKGTEDPRDWMVPEVSGYHPSFFSYWKKVERVLRKKFN